MHELVRAPILDLTNSRRLQRGEHRRDHRGDCAASMPEAVVAHDYLTQRGGAERVALALLSAFPGAPMVTSVYDSTRTFPGYGGHRVRTSALQQIPLFRRDPRFALPLLASTWGRTIVSSADVVVASSSGWAHGVVTTPGVRKIVYCHNPARWLYQPDDYVNGSRQGKAVMAVLRKRLIEWDLRAAQSADRYLVNSSVVRDRVRRVYGINAEVLSPPVSVDVHAERQAVPGIKPGFFLTVARGRAYKNTDTVAEAIAGLSGHRLVVVGGDRRSTSGQTTHLGVVTDAELRWLYAHARALVSVSHEDFGLTPIEANAFGTPALLLRSGGFLDTLREGVSGAYIDEPTAGAVRSAVRVMDEFDPAAVTAHATTYSIESFVSRLHAIVDEVTTLPVFAPPQYGELLDLRPLDLKVERRESPRRTRSA